MGHGRAGRLAAVVMIAVGGVGVGAVEERAGEESEDPPEAVFVDETSVTAAYRAEADTPVTHTDIPAEDLERKSFGQEPPLLLAETPSVTFSTDSGGIAGYSYFRLRGIDQTRVNMTLDGVPLNEPEDQGVYFSNFPNFLSSVRSIQVQRGVGTSSNGVASYAGSILFETPSLTGGPQAAVGMGLGSQGTERVYAEISTDLGAGASSFLRASHLSSEGFKHHSGNESESVFFSVGWPTGRHLLKLTGFAGHQENGLAWLGVPFNELEQDRRANGNTPEETDRFTQSLTMLQHSVGVSTSTTVASCVYFNSLDGDYDFDLDNFLGLGPGSELYNYDFRSRFLGGFANLTHAGRGFEVSGGVHVNRYQRRHRGSGRSAGPLYENTGYKDEASAFGKLGVTVGRWLLFGDVQVRTASFDYRGSVAIDRLRWSFVNPRLGMSGRLSDGLLVYYSVGRTGREPTRNDLFGGYDDLGVDNDGNPLLVDLPQEEVLDHELGLRITGRRWSMSSNLYWMQFANEIVLNGQFGPNGLPLHSNVADSFRSGLEFEARLEVGGGIALVHSSALSHNRIREAGVSFEPVLTPEVVVNQEVALERGRLTASLRGRYQSGSWVDFANAVELPSFAVMDVTVGVRYGQFRFDLHGLNLLDERATIFGSIRADGVPGYFVHPPRSVFAAVRWTS